MAYSFPKYGKVRVLILTSSEISFLYEGCSRVQRIAVNSNRVATSDKPAFVSSSSGRGDPVRGHGGQSSCGDHGGGRNLYSGNQRGRGGAPRCSHYGLLNHIAETYWNLHGKLAWANQTMVANGYLACVKSNSNPTSHPSGLESYIVKRRLCLVGELIISLS